MLLLEERRGAISWSQRWFVVFIGTLLAIGGCRSIPDLKPFAEATAKIDLAANQTHDFVVVDLSALVTQAPNATPMDRNVRDALKNARDGFSKEWKIRLHVIAALVDYSASLASIAEAGKSGGESARGLATSVNGLLGSIPHVTTQIPAAAIDLAAWIKSEVDKVKAAESLAAAVKEAHPVILQIASILAADFAAVSTWIDANVLAAQTLINHQYGSVPVYRDSLIQRQDAVATRIASMAVGTPIPEADVAEAKLLGELIEKINPEYQAYREAYDRAASRGVTEKAIVAKAEEAVKRWAKLHGEIQAALEEKRAPSAATLTNKALELKELIEKLRNQV